MVWTVSHVVVWKLKKEQVTADTFSLDLECSANQSKEGGIKGHHPIRVQRHVHRYQTLTQDKEEEKFSIRKLFPGAPTDIDST